MIKQRQRLLFLLLGSSAVGALLVLLLVFWINQSSTRTPHSTPRDTTATSSRPNNTNSIAWMLSDTTSSKAERLKREGGNASEVMQALQQQNDDLTILNDQLKVQLADIFQWMLDNYKGKFPLAESQITNLNLSPVNASFNLAPAVAEFMHLTDDEAEKLNDLFEYGGGALSDIIDNNISVSEYESGKVVLHIPTFPVEGAILQEDIYTALDLTLGSHRFNRLLDVSEQALKSDFHYFGNATHTIIFEPIYSDTSDERLWTIKDGWIIQEADHSKTIKATETTVVDIPEAYDRYAVYLPDYLQQTTE